MRLRTWRSSQGEASSCAYSPRNTSSRSFSITAPPAAGAQPRRAGAHRDGALSWGGPGGGGGPGSPRCALRPGNQRGALRAPAGESREGRRALRPGNQEGGATRSDRGIKGRGARPAGRRHLSAGPGLLRRYAPRRDGRKGALRPRMTVGGRGCRDGVHDGSRSSSGVKTTSGSIFSSPGSAERVGQSKAVAPRIASTVSPSSDRGRTIRSPVKIRPLLR